MQNNNCLLVDRSRPQHRAHTRTQLLRLVYHVSRACMNGQGDGTNNTALARNGTFSAGFHAHATIMRVVEKIGVPVVAECAHEYLGGLFVKSISGQLCCRS